MNKKEGMFGKLLLLVGSVFLIGMVLVVLTQIYYRFVLQKPLSWSEEVARGFFIWAAVIGAAIAMNEKLHTNLTVFFDKFPPKARFVVASVTSILTIVFFTVVFVYGMRLTMVAHMNTSPALKLPMSYFYASAPIGCGIMAIFAVRDLIDLWFKKGTRGDNG